MLLLNIGMIYSMLILLQTVLGPSQITHGQVWRETSSGESMRSKEHWQGHAQSDLEPALDGQKSQTSDITSVEGKLLEPDVGESGPDSQEDLHQRPERKTRRIVPKSSSGDTAASETSQDRSWQSIFPEADAASERPNRGGSWSSKGRSSKTPNKPKRMSLQRDIDSSSKSEEAPTQEKGMSPPEVIRTASDDQPMPFQRRQTVTRRKRANLAASQTLPTPPTTMYSQQPEDDRTTTPEYREESENSGQSAATASDNTGYGFYSPMSVSRVCPATISSCRNLEGPRCNSTGPDCSCDLSCLVYRDCCEDFQTLCPEIYQEAVTTNGHLLDLELTCIEESSSLVISSCPQSAWRSIVQPCLEGGRMKNLGFVPVTDTRSGVHFLNRHCAACNGVVDFTPWQAAVVTRLKQKKTETSSGENTSEGSSTDSTTNAVSTSSGPSTTEEAEGEHSDTFSRDPLGIWLPEARISKKRSCVPKHKLISDCPPKSIPTVTQICRKYTSLVKGEDTSILFANRFCLYCNKQRTCTKVTCQDVRDPLNVQSLNFFMQNGSGNTSEIWFSSAKPQSSRWTMASCETDGHLLWNCTMRKCGERYAYVKGMCLLRRQEVKVLAMFRLPDAVRHQVQSDRRLSQRVVAKTAEVISDDKGQELLCKTLTGFTCPGQSSDGDEVSTRSVGTPHIAESPQNPCNSEPSVSEETDGSCLSFIRSLQTAVVETVTKIFSPQRKLFTIITTGKPSAKWDISIVAVLHGKSKEKHQFDIQMYRTMAPKAEKMMEDYNDRDFMVQCFKIIPGNESITCREQLAYFGNSQLWMMDTLSTTGSTSAYEGNFSTWWPNTTSHSVSDEACTWNWKTVPAVMAMAWVLVGPTLLAAVC